MPASETADHFPVSSFIHGPAILSVLQLCCEDQKLLLDYIKTINSLLVVNFLEVMVPYFELTI